jgi:hypothetical protein
MPSLAADNASHAAAAGAGADAGNPALLLMTSARAWPAMVGIGLGVLALGPGIGRGFMLSYDMVFVPSPPISAAVFGLTGGPPRAVPSDVVVAVLDLAVSADIVQKLILISIFALACSGAAALLATCFARVGRPVPSAPARLAAGVFYAWNPFVAERLLLGQWAMLLGYAGLPWVLRSIYSGGRRIRLRCVALALLPAAVGGFSAMGISALAALPAAVADGGDRARVRRLATVLSVMGVLSLPWLIPALLVPVHTDPAGVSAFAARADTPFGRAGSLLLLGGAWNAQTVPAGYGGIPAVAWLIVVLAAAAGYLLVARPCRICPGLGVGAMAGLAIAAIVLSGPSRAALRDLIAVWPGFAVLRDGQQYLAPLALADAVGMGAGVAWVTGSLKATISAARAPRWGGDAAGTAALRAASALGVMAVLAPVLLLPGLAWGAAGRLHPVYYPADWLRARQLIDSDPVPGAAVLLPWAAYRRFAWNAGEAVLDPWPRLLHRQVIWNDALQVGQQTVTAENPAALRLNPVIAAAGPLTAALGRAGVRYVVVDAGRLLHRPGRSLAAAARLPGASVLVASGDLVVFRLPGPAAQAGARS